MKDENPPSYLKLTEFQDRLKSLKKKHGRKALGQDGKINILAMESCLMNMVEVGYQLRDHVKIMVGSQGFVPNIGWPYQRILADLTKQPTTSPDQLAKNMVNLITRYYTDFLLAGESIDIGACDLQHVKKLAGVDKNLASSSPGIKQLADILIAGLNDSNRTTARRVQNALILAHWRAQSYNFEQFVDLWDFCYLLEDCCKLNIMPSPYKKRVVSVCKSIRSTIGDDHNSGFVLRSCYSGPDFQHSHGVSIYFPWVEVWQGYKEFEFATKTRWYEFLETYIARTRREPRVSPGLLDPSVTERELGLLRLSKLFVRRTDPNYGPTGRVCPVKNPAREVWFSPCQMNMEP
jgi:hypothetical protein